MQPTNMQIATNDHLKVPCTIDNFMSADECKKIIKLGESLALADASLESTDGTANIDNNIRQSETKWLKPSDDTSWIFQKIRNVILQANENYKFEISGIENMQIARYANSGFYEWHMDIGKGILSCRKISISIQLSESDSYNGGDLEFFNKGISASYKPTKELGAAIIFPSFLTHRVTPVTEGERWSLVAWINGPPYR